MTGEAWDSRCAITSRECDVKHASHERLLNLEIRRVEDRMEAMDKALRLHAVEMERRLEGLNKLREDVVRDRDMLLKKETYDIRSRSMDAWMVEVNRKITVIETRSVVWTTAIGMMFVVLQIAIHFWR